MASSSVRFSPKRIFPSLISVLPTRSEGGEGGQEARCWRSWLLNGGVIASTEGLRLVWEALIYEQRV